MFRATTCLCALHARLTHYHGCGIAQASLPSPQFLFGAFTYTTHTLCAFLPLYWISGFPASAAAFFTSLLITLWGHVVASTAILSSLCIDPMQGMALAIGEADTLCMPEPANYAAHIFSHRVWGRIFKG